MNLNWQERDARIARPWRLRFWQLATCIKTKIPGKRTRKTNLCAAAPGVYPRKRQRDKNCLFCFNAEQLEVHKIGIECTPIEWARRWPAAHRLNYRAGHTQNFVFLVRVLCESKVSASAARYSMEKKLGNCFAGTLLIPRQLSAHRLDGALAEPRQ